MLSRILRTLVLWTCALPALNAQGFGQENRPIGQSAPQVLLRCDDVGMCHTVNMAATQAANAGLPLSFSVMFACPWYQEAVEILKEHPEISVGVHLTLNAEWKHYRWGPVSGAQSVPSLVDSNGFFFPSRDLFFSHNPRTAEVERELRAQIDRALRSGLRIDYVDYHMGTAVSTPELRLLVETLAHEYNLGISRYFGEVDAGRWYAAPPDAKLDSLVAATQRLTSDTTWLMVFHIGLDTQEMQALVDLNSFGLPNMSKHRNAELNALTSETFLRVSNQQGLHCITYRDLIGARGLQSMKRPDIEY
jgi:predicted glycoside hydrolase/deacetylase ChbG (UPF0249 family)